MAERAQPEMAERAQPEMAERAQPEIGWRARTRLDGPLGVSLALCGLACALLAHLAVDDAAHAATYVETRALGHRVAPEDDPLEAARVLARAYVRETVTLVVGSERRRVSRSVLGLEPDEGALAALLTAARDPGSALRRYHAQLHADAPLDLPVPARLRKERAERYLRLLAEHVDEPPRLARADLRTGSVTPARRGLRLDVPAALDALTDAALRGTRTAQLPVIARALPREAESAPATVDASMPLGTFETTLPLGDRARAHDLHVAARLLDGAVLPPRATLDLRALLPSWSGRAFRRSPAHGGDEDGLEGTRAQLAGTVHAAALFAGLAIVEHHPARVAGRGLELGLDATLASDRNLRIQNDLPHAIVLTLTVGPEQLRASFRGARDDAQEVTVARRLEQVLPYAEVTRPDATLPRGTSVVAQHGALGFRAALARRIVSLESGAERRDQRLVSIEPLPRIVRVGTAKASGGTAGLLGEPRVDYEAAPLLVWRMHPSLALPEESRDPDAARWDDAREDESEDESDDALE